MLVDSLHLLQDSKQKAVFGGADAQETVEALERWILVLYYFKWGKF